MSAVKSGGLAVAGALAIASLTVVPAALAVDKPTPHPTRKTTSPRPTVTKSITVTAKPTTPKPSPTPKPVVTCNPTLGLPAIKTAGWGQQRLDFTRAWKQTQGAGVSVAVVDSGVDARYAQLSGRVTSADVTQTVPGDCVGHGTAVAGIIAAKDLRAQNIPFVGVAPAAHVISVKFTNQAQIQGADPNLPKAIRRAVDLGAEVINVSVQAPDTIALHTAVQYALSHDVVVVASAGNVTDEQKGTVGPAYPAEYPGVVSVGSLDSDGSIADSSNTVTRVSVSAPGKDVISTWPGGFRQDLEGTSYAAAYVSGTAALVRAYHPDLSQQQVKARIEATADGSVGTGSGAGMVDPVQAVTAILPSEGRASASHVPAVQPKPVRVAYRRPRDERTRSLAMTLAGGALVACALVVAGGVLIPMGRRRKWRPGRRTTPRTEQDT
ncbi:S8 family serine peptidase [Actinoallomurus rhizosphaericola]|uniref:S8 family serine peptidase n=1 Tax=Actinoallomurus rhizosphaericola TaxID=2952536 RepID=UPI002093B552|nr:S8 family serine peptidase [Actinoallomurus rhizosphaericola]MCO5996139.1 S8 family serine peptidase [Actinoallomurus rhizosphaericola]